MVRDASVNGKSCFMCSVKALLCILSHSFMLDVDGMEGT
jgi:hypothetical protein